MAKKQYIKASNEAPAFYLNTILIWAMAIKVFRLWDWLWGALLTFAVLSIATTIYRFFNEDGVDVVKRGDE